jgi:hypothetical protein
MDDVMMRINGMEKGGISSAKEAGGQRQARQGFYEQRLREAEG